MAHINRRLAATPVLEYDYTSVSGMNKMAKTIETTVIIEVAMLLRMICATCGS